MFLLFQYLSLLIITTYDIFITYDSIVSKANDWSGLDRLVIITYATLPVFLLSTFFLHYFLCKNNYISAVIPGITFVIIALFGLLLLPVPTYIVSPLFIVSAFFLHYFLYKSEYINAIIPGIFFTIIILGVVFVVWREF